MHQKGIKELGIKMKQITSWRLQQGEIIKHVQGNHYDQQLLRRPRFTHK